MISVCDWLDDEYDLLRFVIYGIMLVFVNDLYCVIVIFFICDLCVWFDFWFLWNG